MDVLAVVSYCSREELLGGATVSQRDQEVESRALQTRVLFWVKSRGQIWCVNVPFITITSIYLTLVEYLCLKLGYPECVVSF